jgi:hypothetical protein
MLVKKALDNFGTQIINRAKANIARKSDTGELGNSLKYNIKVSKNSIEFTLEALDYASFVDQGVKGFKSDALAPYSPFKYGKSFGSGNGGLTKALIGWVGRKRFQFKNEKSGKFLSYKQTALLIARSIYNKGKKPTRFLTDAFNKEIRRLPKELIEAYGLDMRDLLKTSLKNNK